MTASAPSDAASEVGAPTTRLGRLQAALRGRRVRRLAAAVALLGVAACGGTAAWHAYRSRAGEPTAQLGERWHAGHQVLDRHGALLREIGSADGNRGRELPLAEMGERLVVATLISEDADFYDHDGIDRQAIARAMAQNVSHARLVSGASTVTQQLVKLLDTGGKPHPKSLAEKLREAARAQNLEEQLPKEKILEAYMNRLPYGRGLVGPEAAARGYFGVSARELSWAQAAWMAVLPRAPAYLDPYTHPERAELRQRALVEALHDSGALADEDHRRALAERVVPRRLERPFLAPHFVESLRQQGQLAEGDSTTTTIDLALQRDVEGLVRTHLAAIAQKRASDAAVLVVDNASGEVLAWVGSADFHDPEISGQVDMVRARRQPGSTLKPFVYALAFARGREAGDLLADVPTRFSEQGRGTYAPENFDGTWQGPISAREALAGSLNVPAIRLAGELEAGELLGSLHRLGFTSLDRDAAHYGLSLALGSGEVSLRELAAAYLALARGGESVPLRVRAGEPATTPVRVMDAEVAALVTDTLSDPLARVRGLHGRGPFDIGFPLAVKTGTSSGHRDTWTVGYTRARTVAVWVGNADGAPTLALSGASGAGPLFADAMRRAMRDVGSRAPLWDEPLLVSAEVCPLSGKLRGPSCQHHASQHFMRSRPPRQMCDLHVRATPVAAHDGGRTFRCGAGAVVAVLPREFDAWLALLPPGAPGQAADGTLLVARA
ncbi:MAG: penicillin-binding protein 1C, partial [Polyangiaceae bacterium]